MTNCTVCGGAEFYKEAGYYFCTECQTKNEAKREEILEIRFDGTHVTSRKIPQQKSEKIDHRIQWTTWEQYNFILIGLTDELIELGATPNLKLTVLQLWAYYLGKIEVAFTSMKRREVPKLARSFHTKDADIIYGKLKSLKRKRKTATSNSSIVSSQQSETSSIRELNKRKRMMYKADYDRFTASQTSESDVLSFVSQSLHSINSGGSQSSVSVARPKFSKHAKIEMKRIMKLSKKLPMSQRRKYQQSHVTTKYRTGPNVITPMKLWAILYLALRINKQDIHLADMLRYGREGHLSFYRLDHLLPAEMTLTDSDVKLLTQNNEITHKGMRRTCAEIAKFLLVNEISCPDFMPLITRYCQDLSLPKRILTYTARLIALSAPKMIFNAACPLIPNYEGRAMAFIIVVLKVLFGIDGITEYEISKIAEKINSEARAKDDLYVRLFSFREWQRYIECRRNIMTRKHFPTKFKNDSDGFENAELYVKFVNSALSRREVKPEIRSYKNTIPRNLTNAMEQCITKFRENSNLNDVEIFPPSQTPQYSYLEQILENPMYDVPDILRGDFSISKIYYLTKPEKFVKFAAGLGVRLQIVESRLHFLHKLVPQFEKSRMPSLLEWNRSVTVVNRRNKVGKGLSVCLEGKDSHRFKLNKVNQSYYDAIQEKLRTNQQNNTREEESSRKSERDRDFDFGFQDVGCEGKLAIPSRCDSDNNNKSKVKPNGVNGSRNKTESLNFYKKYNLQIENDSVDEANNQAHKLLQISKQKKIYTRDWNGRFVEKNSPKVREEPTVYKTPRKILKCSNARSNESENLGERYFESENDRRIANVDESISTTASSDLEQLFIPSKEYWMYHCVFSRVKPKNFEFFECELPVNFQWLLNECADIVEMSTEDLYEQVCLVETYLGCILRPDDISENDSDYWKKNQSKINGCKKKW